MNYRISIFVLTLAVFCLPCANLRADEPPVANLLAAESEPVPGAQSGNEDALYVLSLLDIPDGESAAFYANRRGEIEQAVRKYVGKTPTREEYDALMEEGAEAYVAINKKIVESADFDKDASPGNFMLYCDSLVKKGALEEIETLLKEEKASAQPNVTRVAALQIASVGAAVVKASDKGDGVMLRKIGAALVEKAAREPSNENLQLFVYGAAQLDRVETQSVRSVLGIGKSDPARVCDDLRRRPAPRRARRLGDARRRALSGRNRRRLEQVPRQGRADRLLGDVVRPVRRGNSERARALREISRFRLRGPRIQSRFRSRRPAEVCRR